jgi:hypothetical protein
MNNKRLNWSGFDWADFQTLCIRIAENLFPDCYFQEYLKQGSEQEGIDLKSFLKKDGSFITIQCKREEKLLPSDIEKIIGELSEEMKNKSSTFVLATSASLQSKNTQNKIDSYAQKLLKDYNIEFQCWDVFFIEDRLRNYWSLIERHFGEGEADRFCYRQLSQTAFDNIQPVDDYIPRKVTKVLDRGKADKMDVWYFLGREVTDLKEELFKDRITTRRICLLGDAYQGKSSYLQQLAYELKNAGKRIQPLLIELKKWDAFSLEDLLNKRYGAWRNIPFKELLLIIDGLDEVPTDKFGEMVAHIKLFSEAYEPVSILVSCRRLFYNHYDVAKDLSAFEAYELYPLQYEDIDYYLQTKLASLYNGFRTECEHRGLTAILYHPFFLVKTVDKFLAPPHRLPDNKLQLLDEFIETTFQLTKARKTVASETVKHESHSFHKIVGRFAFALQFAGLNGFSDDMMQQLFPKGERSLLQHNSLVSVSANTWSFTNALFQEHLAARLMADMSLEEILAITTVGKTIRKIKTKWIQTIASLLSILEQSHPLYQPLLEFIETDNIELIFQTEASKHTSGFKFEMLKKLVDKCVALNIRPMLTYEETIGGFIAGNSKAIRYLFTTLEKNSVTNRVKISCCHILRAARIPAEMNDSLIDIAKRQIAETADADYAGELVKVIATNKIGDEALIRQLIEVKKFEVAHPYRDSLYELIMVMEMAEKFYTYGLNGFAALARYNSGTIHSGSEYYLEQFLLQTNNRYQLGALLTKMQTPEWTGFYRYKTRNEGFVHNLFQKLICIFESDPRIIIQVAHYIKALGKQYLREDYREVDGFLEATDSHWLVVRVLINDMFKDNEWEFGGLITSDSYDYVFFEFEEENHDVSVLSALASGLRRKKKEEIADVFLEMCNHVVGSVSDDAKAAEYEAYRRNVEQKKKNDIRVIQSPDAFKQGVSDFFKVFGKKEVSENDLYLDLDESSQYRKVNSLFIYHLFIQLRGDNRRMSLQRCLKAIDDAEFFTYFRAHEILHYHVANEEAKEVFENILRDFYNTELAKADFVNCKWSDGTYHEGKREVLLGQIFEKYRFPTAEKDLIQMIWLDNGGIYNYLNARSNKRDCFSEIIINSLSISGQVALKKQIIENIKMGIYLEGVLGNHIALCKRLMITEAKELLLSIIAENLIGNHHVSGYIDAYLEIGGEKAQLLPFFISFTAYEQHLYFHFVRLLLDDYPQQVKLSLHFALNQTADTQTKITAARYLAHLGSLEGLQFLVTMIENQKKSPYEIQSGLTIDKIPTSEALGEIKKIIHLLVDKEYHDNIRFFESAKNILLEWLNALAAKSEADLEIVYRFLAEQLARLKDEYNEAPDLNWYMNRMVENFRGSDKEIKTIKEIKTVLKSLEIL